MNLPYLLKPKSLNTSKSDGLGSQETKFHGFGDSPYGQVNKQLYGSQLQYLRLPQPEMEPATATITSEKRPSPGMKVFPRFYGSILEENSCNAVDMSDSETIPSAAAAVPPVEGLSFNGKIKSLTETPTAPSEPQADQLSESFILKKINNERSPDLFAEDSEEDDEDNDETDKGLGTTLDDLPEGLEESQSVSEAPSTSFNASARYSLNAPTESSFVDEQTQDTQLTSNDPRALFMENCRRERELHRRIRRCLQGVRPPPTVTMPDMDIINTVVDMKTKVLNWLDDHHPASTYQDSGIAATPSLFKPTHSLAEAQSMSWREILGVRHHGLRYKCLELLATIVLTSKLLFLQLQLEQGGRTKRISQSVCGGALCGRRDCHILCAFTFQCQEAQHAHEVRTLKGNH